jgi:hypothetical protein
VRKEDWLYSEKKRYWRLAFLLFFTGFLPSVVEQLLAYPYGLSYFNSSPVSESLVRLLFNTVCSGLCLGLPIWLALEHFRPKQMK